MHNVALGGERRAEGWSAEGGGQILPGAPVLAVLAATSLPLLSPKSRNEAFRGRLHLLGSSSVPQDTGILCLRIEKG